MKTETVESLSKAIVDILDKKCKKGISKENYSWIGFQNANGTECGLDIERLISRAKKVLSKEQLKNK